MRAGPRMVYLVPLVILALPGVLVWLGTLEPVRSRLVPWGAPPRWLLFGSAVVLLVLAAVTVTQIPSSSDQTWLIVGPAMYALGLGAIAMVVSSLLPEHYRTSFTSGVILALVVLCVLNAAVLVGWAMTDDRDLNGNAIRPPVFRVVSVLAAAALLVLGVGQLRLRTRG